MKHEIWELKQMQSLPLEAKINMTLRRIIDWKQYWDERGEDVYISSSGGKDSQVLKHIALSFYPNMKRVFVDTGLEYPELREFQKKDKDMIILKPSKPFWQVVRDYGYPVISKEVSECIENARKYLKAKNEREREREFHIHNTTTNSLELANIPQRVQKIMGTLKQRSSPDRSAFNLEKWKCLIDAPFKISSKCCSIMKKTPLHKYNKQTKSHPITAEMAAESRLRTTQWLRNGCNGFDMKEPKSTPMSFWTEQDVLQYIKKYNVEIPSVYGNIIEDVGIEEGFEQLTICETGCQLKTTGCNRTGCMFCLFGSHLEKGKSRFERMKQTHPKLYDYCINGGEFNEDGIWQPNRKGLGLGFVMDTINKLCNKKILKY